MGDKIELTETEKMLAHRAEILDAEKARLSGETYSVEEVRTNLREKYELTEDEMIAEIDRALQGENSDRFTPDQAEKLRKRMGKITDDERKKREFIWDTVIRVKENEGLTVSDYITELASKHIAGDITLEEVYVLIDAAKEKKNE